MSELYPSELNRQWAYFANKILKGQPVIFSQVYELPADRLGKEVWQHFRMIGVTSVAAFPFKVGEQIIGCVSWESYGIRQSWPDEMVDRLRMISEVFANALSRKRSETALRKLL